MDLIYRDATKALGLSTTPIRTKRGLRLIELLLSSQLCWKAGRSCYVLNESVSYSEIIALIQVLYSLTKDIWWTRAWIFQEEYISGLQMDLLIPLAAGVDECPSNRSIPGELCVGASEFREHATTFLLAYKNTSWKSYRASCDRILSIIGKYNILFPGPENSLVCMSARILADIGKRDITNQWDVLAITANACAYELRLDGDALPREKKSLSLCLLALYLLNGEVMRVVFDSDEKGKDLLDNDIATLVKRVSLQQDSSPFATARQLSFFKNCRLSPVRFLYRGTQTLGCLWRLQHQHRIHTRSLSLSSRSHRQDSAEYDVWDASLTALSEELRRKHPSLASKLMKYVDDRRSGTCSLALGYMDRMADSLVEAIKERHVLRIGYLEGGGGGAVFVPHRDDVSEPMHAFTAWRTRSSDISNLDNFVSLKVDVNGDGSLNVVNWMSGLAFFQGFEARPVILAWPGSWKRSR